MANRIAFKMKLKPGALDEYKIRHDAIWPELKDLLSQNGISEYSIFFDHETHYLFGIQKICGVGSSQDLGGEDIVQRWWNYMADLMEVNADNSPVTQELIEVFHMA